MIPIIMSQKFRLQEILGKTMIVSQTTKAASTEDNISFLHLVFLTHTQHFLCQRMINNCFLIRKLGGDLILIGPMTSISMSEYKNIILQFLI